MKIGYARVSSKWYQSEIQIAELEKHGCKKILGGKELVEGASFEANLKTLFAQITKGDTVIAVRIAHVAQSSTELLAFLEGIKAKGAYFKSLEEPWANFLDETGEFVLSTIRGMIQFEKTQSEPNTLMVPKQLQSVGVKLGRPQKLSEQQKFEALSLLKLGKTAAEIGRRLGVSRSTISRMKVQVR